LDVLVIILMACGLQPLTDTTNDLIRKVKVDYGPIDCFQRIDEKLRSPLVLVITAAEASRLCLFGTHNVFGGA